MWTRRAAIVAAALVLSAVGYGLWRHAGPGRSAAPSRPPPVPEGLLESDTPSSRVIGVALRDVRENGRDSAAWYRLALAYEANNASDLALECLREAVALDPSNARAWYHAALVREHGGDLDGAVADMERAVAAAPTYSPARWRLGDWRLDRDDVDGAAQAYSEALRLDPTSVRAVAGAARVAQRRGDHAGVVSSLSAMTARGLDDPLVHQLLGHSLARIGRDAEAETSFARARRPATTPPDPWLAEIEPFRVDARAQFERAQQMVMTGRAAAAIPILEALVANDPDNAGLVCNLAAAHRLLGDLNRSATMLEDAVRRFPDSWQAHYNLALTTMTAWRSASGANGAGPPASLRFIADHADAAIRSNPAYAPAHALRGDVHTALGEFAAAADSYRAAAVAEPSNPAWQAQLGVAHLRAGAPGEAVSALRRASDLAPGDPSILTALADAMEADGRGPEAQVVRARAEAMMARLAPGPRRAPPPDIAAGAGR